jgi:predicted transcriptional regulator
MKNLQVFGPLPHLRELTLLQELEKTPVVSQRKLAILSGMALGVTNTCLRRMAERGWIQVRHMNGHRMGYYLTKKGILEKDRLISEMACRSIEHYAWMKDLMKGKLIEMQSAGIRRIVFYGTSDEIEIAYMTLQELDLILVGIIEDEEMLSQEEMFGFKLTEVEDITALNPEGILVTSFSGIEGKMRKLEKYIDPSKVKILSI